MKSKELKNQNKIIKSTVNNLTRAEEWYFIKQDIVSYTISTILYLVLCLFRTFTIQTLIYALFEILLFYVSFWFIRVNFDDTYHSNIWKTCKIWTRIMLCASAILLGLLPIEYSLFNSLFVAFLCALILYIIAIKHPRTSIYAMSEEDLYQYCRSRGLSEEDCRIAYFIIIERLKGKALYNAIGYSESQAKRHRKRILKILK